MSQILCWSWKLFPMGIPEEEQPMSSNFEMALRFLLPCMDGLSQFLSFQRPGPYEIPCYGLDFFVPDPRCGLCDYVEFIYVFNPILCMPRKVVRCFPLLACRHMPMVCSFHVVHWFQKAWMEGCLVLQSERFV